MAKNIATESTGKQAPALRRAVKILDMIASAGHPMTFTDIVTQLDLPKSSAHGLCHALVEMDILQRNKVGELQIGSHVMNWASAFFAHTSLVESFQQLLNEHQDLHAFTVTLTVLEGAHVIYLACAHSSIPLEFTFRIGMRLPAPFTATGKAMLSTMHDEEIVQRLKNWPAPMTANSVTSVQHLLQEVTTFRKQGFSVDNGQIREGMYCVAAPVRDYHGNAIAGIAVSLLEREATPDAIIIAGKRLTDVAQKLSSRLGYQLK